MNIEDFVSRAEKAEKEIEVLKQELDQLLSSSNDKIVPQNQGSSSEELEKLRTENSKLKYRVGILQRATAAAAQKKQKMPVNKPKMNSKEYMLSILNNLEHIFRDAVTEAFPDVPDPPCPITPSAKFGDYQFNGAMAMAGLLKVFFHQ